MSIAALVGFALVSLLAALVACERKSTNQDVRIPAIRPDLKRGSATRVTADDQQLTLESPGHAPESIRWANVQRVSVVTTDEGPWLTDVFIVLEGATSRLVVPSDTEGSDAFVGLVVEIDGFDHMTFVQAMGSAENAEFVCWTGPTVRFRETAR